MECLIYVRRTETYTKRCVRREPGDLYLTLYYISIKSHSVRRFVRHQLVLCAGHVRRTHLSFHTGGPRPNCLRPKNLRIYRFESGF